MREIKYRQRLQNDKWHYWGFIEGTFVTPMLADGIEDAYLHSQQFTGLKDKNGVEIYESDLLNHNGLEGEIWWNEDLGAWMWADELLGNHHKELVVVGNRYEQSSN